MTEALDNNKSLRTLRILSAELLAYAMCRLFPKMKLIAGSATDTGSYYDFAADIPITDSLCQLLEEEMRGLIKADTEVRHLEMMRENAAAFFEHRSQPLVAAQAASAPRNTVSLIQIDDFFDLAPSLPTTTTLEGGAIKILEIEKVDVSVAQVGSVQAWRIHMTAQTDNQKLKQFLKKWQQAKKIDHRLLGSEMTLFESPDDQACIDWLWHPKGTMLRETLMSWWQNELSTIGFQNVASPPFAQTALLKLAKNKTSTEHYSSSLLLEETPYTLAPPPARAHARLFAAKQRFAEELPIRYAEWNYTLNTCTNGQIYGLLRSRISSCHYGHIFCLSDQLQEELISSLHFISKTVTIMGFEHYWQMKPYARSATGDSADKAMAAALSACGIEYRLCDKRNPEGPVAELIVTDHLGREWQGPWVAIDVALAAQWQLRYNERRSNKAPSLIALSLCGNLERTIALLLELHAGSLPLWLAPEQVRLIAIAPENRAAAGDMLAKLHQEGFRAALDKNEEPLAARVHVAEIARVPYILMIGDKEQQTGNVAVRSGKQSRNKFQINFAAFLQQLHEENRLKRSE